MGLTSTEFITYTDYLTAVMLAAKGNSSAGTGLGDNTLTGANQYGSQKGLSDLMTALLSSQDWSLINVLGASINQSQGMTSYQSWSYSALSSVLNSLVVAIVNLKLTGAGGGAITTIDQYAAYYNTGAGGWWNALLAPDFISLYNAYSGANPSVLNVYSPAISNMGTFTVGGSFTAGANVDTTKYAGAAISQITVASLTGSGVVTVTGSNQNSVAGHTWTATASADTTYALTPTIAGDLLTAVSGISVASGITAGAITVSGAIPTGRSNPPVL